MSDTNARARRRAFWFGSLERNGLIGRRAGAAGAAGEGAVRAGFEGAAIPEVGDAVGAGAAASIDRASGGVGVTANRGALGAAGGAACALTAGAPSAEADDEGGAASGALDSALADAFAGALEGAFAGTLDGTLNGADPIPRVGGANRSSDGDPVVLDELGGADGVGVRGARLAGGGDTSRDGASGAPNAAGGTGIDTGVRDAGFAAVSVAEGADDTGDAGTNACVGDGDGGYTGVTCAGVSGVGRRAGSGGATVVPCGPVGRGGACAGLRAPVAPAPEDSAFARPSSFALRRSDVAPLPGAVSRNVGDAIAAETTGVFVGAVARLELLAAASVDVGKSSAHRTLAPTGISPAQIEQRARRLAPVTFAGSTLNTEWHSGQETFMTRR